MASDEISQWMEDADHDTALFAVSTYATKRSVYQVRFYYSSAVKASAAASRIREMNVVDRCIVVTREAPDQPWRPLNMKGSA